MTVVGYDPERLAGLDRAARVAADALAVDLLPEAIELIFTDLSLKLGKHRCEDLLLFQTDLTIPQPLSPLLGTLFLFLA